MRVFIGASILVVGMATVAWTQATPPVPQPDPVNFTGKAVGHATADIRTLRYSFEPGARTNWHSHGAGQLILIESGRMRTQERGGPIREYGPRQSFVTEPAIVHWHGALPNEPVTQVALSFGATTWSDRVTDDQYAGKK